MALTAPNPTAGTLQFLGAVVIGTIVDGAFVQYTGGGGGVDSVNGATGDITLVPPDTGWTSNAGVGDKTVSIPNYTSTGFAGSDTVSQVNLDALGVQVQALTAKLQALQSALANNLRPNA